MMVLWLLILRGIAIEFREHVQSLVWQPLWDAVFSVASALLGSSWRGPRNVVRGVPLDRAGTFLPLLDDFTTQGRRRHFGLVTVLVAIAAAGQGGAGGPSLTFWVLGFFGVAPPGEKEGDGGLGGGGGGRGGGGVGGIRKAGGAGEGPGGEGDLEIRARRPPRAPGGAGRWSPD